jgi:hypothetical protein
MGISLSYIYDDLKKFRNPITGGPMSGKGRNSENYPNVPVKNIAVDVQWGVKTITWTGFVNGTPTKKDRNPLYPVVMRFVHKGMSKKRVEGYLHIKTVKNVNAWIPKINFYNTPVLISCGCNDFRYRFEYWLFGKGGMPWKFRPYKSKGLRPPVNPKKTTGLCKHVNGMAFMLRDAGILTYNE